MRLLSAAKAAALAVTFAPIVASAAPVSVVQFGFASSFDRLGPVTVSNGARGPIATGSDSVYLPFVNAKGSPITTGGTLTFGGITFSNFSFQNPGNVIYANASGNGATYTQLDFFSLPISIASADDLTQFQQANFTADGTAAFKALIGRNPDGTKLNSDGSFKSGGIAGTFQNVTYDPSLVPEPAALALFGMGAGLLGMARRRAN